MSPGQHTAGGPADRPFGPGFTLRPAQPAQKRRPQYRGRTQLPGGGRRRGRRSSARLLLGSLVLLALIAAAVALVIATRHNNGSGNAARNNSTSSTTTTTVPPPPALQATIAGWKLPVPVRDATALAGPGGTLLVIGGETASGASADGVFTLDPTSGTLHQVDALLIAVHDAAAATVGPTVYVMGGAAGSAIASVQTFPLDRAGSSTATTAASGPGAPVPAAGSAGPLPAARSGAAAAAFGGHAYLVGGFDGATPEPTVLSTTDGKTFSSVATLPVPVQDAAVVALGHNIYVFGGFGSSATKPVSAVQKINLLTGKAHVVAHLPEGVRGASAFVLGQDIYVAGGQTKTIGFGVGTNKAIWSFDPARDRVLGAGQLATPVAYAATAVVGGAAWLVAGESGGIPVASVQKLTVAPLGSVPTGAPVTSAPGNGSRPKATTTTTKKH